MLPKGLRRVRKPNYTREETEILLDQLLNYGNFLFGKSQPGVNNQQRADVWASIACMVNAVPNSAGRTVEELKHRWQDLAQRARAALRKHSDNKEQLLQKQMPYMDKVLRIMGEVRPDSISSRGSHSPAHSNDTSDPDTSLKVEVKQEKFEVERESPVILNQTVNSLKRMLTPLKTPSLKRLKVGKKYNPSTVTTPDHYGQNGMPSLAHPSFHSQSHSRILDCSQSPSTQTDLADKKTSSDYFYPRSHRKSRPMVMDPESQLIMEVDLMEENDGSPSSTEDHKEDDLLNKDGNSTSSEADSSRLRDHRDAHINVGGTTQNGRHFGVSQAPRSKRKSVRANPYPVYSNQSNEIVDEAMEDNLEIQRFEGLSTIQLQRLSLISKIRLQNQQRRYVKLKEEKLRLELEVLKSRTLSCPSMAKASGGASPVYQPEHSPVSSVHNAEHSDECQRLSHLSPLTASGAMEFEVEDASESKHDLGKELEALECGGLVKSNDENACVHDGEENGDESSSILIKDVHSGGDENLSENHHAEESENSDGFGSPKQEMYK